MLDHQNAISKSILKYGSFFFTYAFRPETHQGSWCTSNDYYSQRRLRIRIRGFLKFCITISYDIVKMQILLRPIAMMQIFKALEAFLCNVQLTRSF